MKPGETPRAPSVKEFAVQLERNDKGRDFAVGDVHGHFDTLRHTLAELELDEHDRVFAARICGSRGRVTACGHPA